MNIETFRRDASIFRTMLSLPRSGSAISDLAVSSVFINILSLALPLILLQAFDRIVPNQATATLWWLVLGGVTAAAIETLLRISRSTTSGWSSARLEYMGSCLVVERLLSCRLVDFERHGVGVYLDRIGALSTLRSFLGGQVFQVAMDLPFTLLFIGVIWFLAGDFILWPLGILLLYIIVATALKVIFQKERSSQASITDRRYNFIIELLGNIHIVKAMGLEEVFMRRYERLQKSNAEANSQVAFWGAIPMHTGLLFSHLMLFTVLIAGGFKVIGGELTLGTLVAVSLLSTRSLQPVQGFMSFWIRMADVNLAREQLAKVAEMPLDLQESLPPFPRINQGNIELQNISFRYSPQAPLLFEDISCYIPHGEMVVIHPGISGSGSTTLMNILSGIMATTGGAVVVEGYSLADWDTRFLVGSIAYIPKEGRLFQGTILDNLTMFQPKLRDAALDAAALVELDDIVAHLPQGYETPVTSQSNNLLPSDLLQRIAVARALGVRPRILLIDQAEVLMGQQTFELLLRLLRHLKGRCTIVLISDNPRITEIADRVFCIRDRQLQPVEGGLYV
ncbi:ABC transporter transmembrane domain-containing protein [Desulfurispira natronophila]|uniref:ATP-binding cassette subfamily C protein LapB n=1 Tax=Desulfurispira natronophila TaxID=682562 RepID=A0A7W7Y5R8_9BACT|nr:ABC transporter transmembrane domain-containing protein [Desulfurispira natronophila]MBB5022492.1 ATP-binding cassette subfamily C protein LapB [Desulfurispira natronophila]